MKNAYLIIIGVLIVAVAILIVKPELPAKILGSDDSKSISVNDAIKTIHSRKSVRDYTDKKVSNDDLLKITKAGMAAPTAMNTQPWEFVIVNEKEKLNDMSDNLPYAQMLKKASAAIIVCGNMNKAIEGDGKDFWIQDCSAASENMLLAIESMGLGAVWIGIYPLKDRVKYLQTAFNMPENVVPLNVLSIGYPTGKDKPKEKFDNKKIHYNSY